MILIGDIELLKERIQALEKKLDDREKDLLQTRQDTLREVGEMLNDWYCNDDVLAKPTWGEVLQALKRGELPEQLGTKEG